MRGGRVNERQDDKNTQRQEDRGPDCRRGRLEPEPFREPRLFSPRRRTGGGTLGSRGRFGPTVRLSGLGKNLGSERSGEVGRGRPHPTGLPGPSAAVSLIWPVLHLPSEGGPTRPRLAPWCPSPLSPPPLSEPSVTPLARSQVVSRDSRAPHPAPAGPRGATPGRSLARR